LLQIFAVLTEYNKSVQFNLFASW